MDLTPVAAAVKAYTPAPEQALVGGLDGADRTARSTAFWNASSQSADVAILPNKEQWDAKAHDMAGSDGFVGGAVDTIKDSIVGAQYVLNARPDWRALGASPEWAREFQQVVESRWRLSAESIECHFDRARKLTFTDQIRLGVGLGVVSGEVVMTSEWLDRVGRPFNTCFQLIAPERLCNPHDAADTQNLRGGVSMDNSGEPLSYHFRQAHKSDARIGDMRAWEWKEVPARMPWGRKRVIHIFDQILPAQTRGVSATVSVLKEMRMTQRLREVELQAAVLGATYAAAIESELPPETIYEQMGQSQGSNGVRQFMSMLAEYYGEAGAVKLDGVKIPVFAPNTKLKFYQPQDRTGMAAYEQGLLRHIAARLNLSYEEFTRDYTNTNYSSARATMLQTWRAMQGRKKKFADRQATEMYTLWLEEQIQRGEVPLPPGFDKWDFYRGLNREAMSRCSWIGASRGQIDELKETQAAVARIKAGLSTHEDEIARLGGDYREVFEQALREQQERAAAGLVFPDLDAKAAPAIQSGNAPNEP